ncbi:MAG TPA: hypothetical protein PLL71_05905 [Agriterribacter sp.]|nr:hypothetical protein [Agriterribacter sp.]
MKKTVICLLLLCGTFYTTVKAQQHLVDSIERELKTPLHDTARALSLMRLAIDYELVDTAKAFAAYKEAISPKKKNSIIILGAFIITSTFFLTSRPGLRKSATVLTQRLYVMEGQTITVRKNGWAMPMEISATCLMCKMSLKKRQPIT